MKEEAEANADTDKAAKETADKINAADGMIFQTENNSKSLERNCRMIKKVLLKKR